MARVMMPLFSVGRRILIYWTRRKKLFNKNKKIQALKDVQGMEMCRRRACLFIQAAPLA